MEVNSSGPIQRAFPVRQVQPTTHVQPSREPKLESPRDEVEISSVGRMLDKLNQSSEVRAERLAHIKAEIDAGTYETPEKLEVAIEKLLAEVHSRDNDV